MQARHRREQIVIGNNAGLNNVGYGSVGIGYNVGSDQFSSNAVAIGPNIVNVNANSIFLNASNANVGSSNPGFFVNPVRNNTGSTGFVMQYNPVTHEILYNSASSGSVTGTGTVTLAGNSIGKMLVTGPSGIAFSSSIEVVNTPFQGIAVSGDLIPTSNNTFSLGNSERIWKDIWVGSGSVNIGLAKIMSSSQDIILSGGITATKTSFIAGVVLGGSNITASVSESSSIGGVTLVNSGITANASSIIGGVTLANSGITATGTFYNGNLTINSSNIYRNTNEEIYLNNVVFKSDGANTYIGSVQNGYFMTLSSTTLVVNAGKTFNAATINSTNGIFQGSSLGGAQFYLSTIDGSRPIITGNGAPGVDSLFLGPTPGNPLLGITSSNSSNFVTIYGANNYNTTIQNGVITTPLLATSQIGGVSIGNYSIQTVFNSSNFIGGVTLVNSNIVCSNITGNVLFSVANI